MMVLEEAVHLGSSRDAESILHHILQPAAKGNHRRGLPHGLGCSH